PRKDFRMQLKSQLISQPPHADLSGETLKESADRNREVLMADEVRGTALGAHDLRAALDALPDKAARRLTTMNEWAVGVTRFSTQTGPWERHPDSDELLHVLEGEIEVTTLTDRGPVHTGVPAGSLFVCHRGLWHRPRPLSPGSMLFVTPRDGTEYSNSEDALHEGRADAAAKRRTAIPRKQAPAISARDIRAALNDLKMLTISSSTTQEEAEAAFRQLGSLNQCGLFVGTFSGMAPWERHAAGDELLHILDGEADITVLTDDGPFQTTVRAGSVVICPRGLWHRQYSRKGVTQLSATPQPTQVSFAPDPRR